MSKTLISGGAGFIGCNISDFCLSHGEEVFIVDNLSRSGTERNLDWLKGKYGDKVHFLKLDICDYEDLVRVMEGTNIVYHMAAQVAVTSSVSNPRQDFLSNALGTFNILESAREVGDNTIVLYASTNKVYGALNNVEIIEKERRYEFGDLTYGIDETQNLDFHSPYGCSKGAADQYMRDYYRIYKLRTVVFRQSCIYGAHQFGNEDQGWLAHFLIFALHGRPLRIYGSGKQVRDILYIDDLLNCYQLAIKNIDKTAGQIYNIGGGYLNIVSILEFIDWLQRHWKKKISYSFCSWRDGDQRIYVSDIRKARKDFGWEPEVSWEEGVERLLSWIRASRDQFS